MYGVSGTPTAMFDGWEDVAGGMSSGSMFSYYNPIVSSHLGSVSPLEITANHYPTGGGVTIDVHIEVTNLISTSDNQVHFVVTRDGVAGEPSVAINMLADEPFTLTSPGQSVDIQRTFSPHNANNRYIVFVQSHSGSLQVLQAATSVAAWVGDTLDVNFACVPESGTVPFTTSMWLTMNNLTPWVRVMAGRIDVTIANGASLSNWKRGATNIIGNGSYFTTWNQVIPALGSMIGTNTFALMGEDVTPSPYNQPPYAESGDTDSQACTLTAFAP